MSQRGIGTIPSKLGCVLLEEARPNHRTIDFLDDKIITGETIPNGSKRLRITPRLVTILFLSETLKVSVSVSRSSSAPGLTANSALPKGRPWRKPKPELQKSCSLPEVNVLAANKNADSRKE